MPNVSQRKFENKFFDVEKEKMERKTAEYSVQISLGAHS